ncbi:Transcription factor MYB3R-5 [Hondaea fermentalgiana]|uniref:Transcription factor MYB3R-5 n=1 Tax=Hondaea fermentalgiana TaxID=2315210 RepID=A0A2R5GTI6_9STRA|nr:Transcription factor MYB3R-5 [Hondaea fermentalgiana]|eukprot:GBG31963.1 Transcription factor MYB3R-5 [Hondaea fermentalgiana]
MRVEVPANIFDAAPVGEPAGPFFHEHDYYEHDLDTDEDEACFPMMHYDDKQQPYYSDVTLSGAPSAAAHSDFAAANQYHQQPYHQQHLQPQPQAHHAQHLPPQFAHEHGLYAPPPMPTVAPMHHQLHEGNMHQHDHYERAQAQAHSQAPPLPQLPFIPTADAYPSRAEAAAAANPPHPGMEVVHDDYVDVWDAMSAPTPAIKANQPLPAHNNNVYATSPASSAAFTPNSSSSAYTTAAPSPNCVPPPPLAYHPDGAKLRKFPADQEVAGLFMNEPFHEGMPAHEEKSLPATHMDLAAAGPPAPMAPKMVTASRHRATTAAATSSISSSSSSSSSKPAVAKTESRSRKQKANPNWQLPDISAKRVKVSSTKSSSDLERFASNGSGASGNSAASGELNKKIYYRRSWTPEEDERLLQLVKEHGAMRWARIAEHMPNKTGNQCSQRWHKALDPTIVKGKWSDAEDDLLVKLVEQKGKKWKEISFSIPGRTGKQCRDRYTARLNPNLRTGKWSHEEEQIALEAHKRLGNRWAAIQKLLPHRSWYTIKWKIESFAKQSSAE